MKFKSVFLLFNAAVGVSFLFVFAMPFIALGSSYAFVFWGSNWPLAIALVLVLGFIDWFFLVNWRLFTLLEQEDWPALAHYLDSRVVGGRRYSARLVRLLANTYLVLSDAASVVALEQKVAAAKPSLLARNALVFGVARILSSDPAAAAAFFEARRKEKGLENAAWVDWYYAFALLLDKKFPEAADQLVALSAKAKDALLLGLCASFLSDSLTKALPERAAEFAAAAESASGRVRAKLPGRAAWDKECARAKADIHIVVLSKPIDEAGAKLYAQA